MCFSFAKSWTCFITFYWDSDSDCSEFQDKLFKLKFDLQGAHKVLLRLIRLMKSANFFTTIPHSQQIPPFPLCCTLIPLFTWVVVSLSVPLYHMRKQLELCLHLKLKLRCCHKIILWLGKQFGQLTFAGVIAASSSFFRLCFYIYEITIAWSNGTKNHKSSFYSLNIS